MGINYLYYLMNTSLGKKNHCRLFEVTNSLKAQKMLNPFTKC